MKVMMTIGMIRFQNNLLQKTVLLFSLWNKKPEIKKKRGTLKVYKKTLLHGEKCPHTMRNMPILFIQSIHIRCFIICKVKVY